MVLVSTKELKIVQYSNRLSKKLRPKFLELYKVLKYYGENAYRLDLLKNLHFHLVLNASQLIGYRNQIGVMRREKKKCYMEYPKSIKKVEVDELWKEEGKRKYCNI
jgi:hypothetical protein